MKLRWPHKENLGDYWLSLTAVGQVLITLIQILLGDSGVVSIEFAALFRVLLSAIFVMVAMIWICKRVPKLLIGTYFLTIFLFILSYIIAPDNLPSILSEGLRLTLCICVPVFLSMSCIKDFSVFKEVCFKVSIFSSVVGIIYGILFMTGNLPMLDDFYNMSYGYALLLPALFFIYKGGWKCILCSAVLFLFIIFCGSRGPIIPYFLFVGWMKWVVGTKKDRIHLIILFCFCLLLVPVLLGLLEQIGLDSRTLYLLMEGSIGTNDAREDINSIVIGKIMESPLWGYGVFGDRVFADGYCHNLFLELFMNFGIYVTFFLLCLAIYMMGFCYKISDKDTRNLCAMFFLFSVVPLMLSNSYLIDFKLYILLGLVWNNLYYKRNNYETSKA